MLLFWILWGIDAIIALVFIYFFFEGLGDGTVSSFNGGLWFLILAALGAVLGGSLWLNAHHYAGVAKVILAIPAVPGLLFGVFMLLMIIINPRWN